MLLKKLIQSRCDPTQRDKFGRIPLFAAVLNSESLASGPSPEQQGCVDILLQHGCCINSVDSHGRRIVNYLEELHMPKYKSVAMLLKQMRLPGERERERERENPLPSEDQFATRMP